MANRLTQIATRTGDNGTTGLGDNTRVSENSLRVHAMGDVDELNSHLGVLLCEDMPPRCAACWSKSSTSFSTWAASCRSPGLSCSSTKPCWRWTRLWLSTTPRCHVWRSSFFRPVPALLSLAHVCRTVARRAERAVVALGNEEALKDTPRQYLNRLSDLMFVLARVLNRYRTDGTVGDDVYWKSERMAKSGSESA